MLSSDMMANDKMVQLFKAMGDENRFQIIMLLMSGDLCVGALATRLNISKPAVSQHLKILRQAGLVRGEKIGLWTHYKVEKDLLRETACQLDFLSNTQSCKDSNADFFCLKNNAGINEQERRTSEMCKNCCEKPDKLKTTPEKCTPEQIKECHGDVKEHSCECNKES
jgi:ArsR family transcriptional regulator, arsenate/arsenite/antimonite-responsive transcriptional repressor